MASQTIVLRRQMFPLRKVYALLACVGIAMIGGCGGSGEESASTQEVAAPTNFNITMVNQKSETITDVTIQGMRLPVKFNKMTSGSSQSLLGKSMAPSDTVTVAWTDRRGDRNEADVKLKLPKRFNGSMKFTIPASGKVVFAPGTAP